MMNLFSFVYPQFKFGKTINVIECFSGIGTQAMALKRLAKKHDLEINIMAISEIDKYAIQSYEAIHGKVNNLGGIGSFDRFPSGVDLCTWSFPCQDISLAGKQKGMKDGTRSNYGYEFLDTVKRTPYNERPKVLLMENVPALVSEKFKDDYTEIHYRLEQLGYTSWGGLMNAKDYGIPQNRERIFVVSFLGEYAYTFPRPIKLKTRLKDYLEPIVDEKYYLSDKQIEQIVNWKAYNKPLENARSENDETIQTITAKSNTSMNSSMILIKEKTDTTICINSKVDGKQPSVQDRIYDSRGISTAITTSYHPNVLIIPEKTKKGYALAEEGDGIYINRPHQKRGVVQKDKIQTIKTSVNDIGVVVKDTRKTIYSDKSVDKILSNIVDVNGVSKTITANPQRATIDSATLVVVGEYRRDEGVRTFKDGAIGTLRTTDAGGDKVVVTNPPPRIRKLTPLEAWRLMGIDDEDFYKAKATGMSDSQLYKQAGNAIVVNVLEALLKEMI